MYLATKVRQHDEQLGKRLFERDTDANFKLVMSLGFIWTHQCFGILMLKSKTVLEYILKKQTFTL